MGYKNIEKIINSKIFYATLNGNYEVKIWDRELSNCNYYRGNRKKINEIFELTKKLKEYYENKGFIFKISPERFGIYRYIDISWAKVEE